MKSIADARVVIGMGAALLLLAGTVIELGPPAAVSPQTRSHAGPPAPHARAALARLPLQFEVNAGQTDGRVRFLSRGPGYTVFLGDRDATIALPAPAAGTGAATRSRAIRMTLRAARAGAPARGESPLPGTVNYFIGDDPSKWRTDVPTYSRVRYESVYDGVDLVYYGNPQQLEYDFVVAPGADPSQIALEFPDESDVRIDERGDLVVGTAGDTRLRKPLIYQERLGGRVEIEGRYARHGEIVGFELGAYDRSRPLIIDPVLVYSTYWSGSRQDQAFGVAVDTAGRVYLTGVTLSPDFPTVAPLQPAMSPADALQTEAFVMRLNAAGSAVEYSTYLGGNGRDLAYGIAATTTGEVVVAGATASTDFPLHNPLQGFGGGSYLDGGDAFVLKLTAAGNALVYSTYVGGSGGEWAWDLALDATGAAYVAGSTTSTNFPIVSAVQTALGSTTTSLKDAFVFKINASGTALDYSTYLGGFDEDVARAIAVDGLGQAYVTGETSSSNFPMQSPLQGVKSEVRDAFITKLDATGSALVYSTYLGGARFGSGNDSGYGIAVDASGRTYVVGQTWSAGGFPSQGAPIGPVGGPNDAFVARIGSDGATLELCRRLGGGGQDEAREVVLDGAGHVFVVGETDSGNFPTAAPLQAANAAPGFFDAFVVRLDDDGDTLGFSTYLGGTKADWAFDAAVDAAGDLVVAGSSVSNDFPTVAPLRGDTSPDLHSMIVFKIAMELVPTVAVSHPNASERLFTGTPYLIEWTASGLIASFNVDISADDGVTYAPVPGCSGLAGASRSCSWNAPGPVTTKGRIRVRATAPGGASASDVSDNRFSVVNGAAVVTVADPNTATTVVAGTARLIKWSHNLGPQSWMRIELSRDGGASWTELAASVQNSSATAGSFLWDVAGPTTAEARVRVTWLNGPVSDVSNVNFSIASPVISMTRPLAGTNWGWDTKQTVYWSTNLPKTEFVTIRMSEDGGASFPHVVAANLAASTGRAVIVTPSLAASTDQARLKVEWVAHEAINGVSPANFRVAFPFVTVTRPDGPATTWTVGALTPIKWAHNLGTLENVKIDLSLDGGASYPIVVSPSTRSDGSESVTVQPGWVTTRGRVRVTWLNNVIGGWDASNADFVIH